MQSVNFFPPSQHGQYLCEQRQGNHTQRTVCNRPAEASRLAKSGAVVYVGRHGGWVKQ